MRGQRRCLLLLKRREDLSTALAKANAIVRTLAEGADDDRVTVLDETALGAVGEGDGLGSLPSNFEHGTKAVLSAS